LGDAGPDHDDNNKLRRSEARAGVNWKGVNPAACTQNQTCGQSDKLEEAETGVWGRNETPTERHEPTKERSEKAPSKRRTNEE